MDLLDAQTQALVAEEVAASAGFDYLIDFMNVQRAVGQFDFFSAPEEYQAFLERLRLFFERVGFTPGPAD